MDDRQVLERLERIDRLDEAGAPAAVMLAEVRALLHEAERLARRSGDQGLESTLDRCQDALDTGRAAGRGAPTEPRAPVLDSPA